MPTIHYIILSAQKENHLDLKRFSEKSKYAPSPENLSYSDAQLVKTAFIIQYLKAEASIQIQALQ